MEDHLNLDDLIAKLESTTAYCKKLEEAIKISFEILFEASGCAAFDELEADILRFYQASSSNNLVNVIRVKNLIELGRKIVVDPTIEEKQAAKDELIKLLSRTLTADQFELLKELIFNV